MDYGEYTKATIMHPCISVFLFFSFVKDFSVFLRFLLSCGLLGVFHNSLKVSLKLFSDK